MALILSEEHFYVLLVDRYNTAATIRHPIHMTSLQPNTTYFWTILQCMCPKLDLRPSAYDTSIGGPEGQQQIIKSMVRDLHDYGGWGLCGVIALSMMLHNANLHTKECNMAVRQDK